MPLSQPTARRIKGKLPSTPTSASKIPPANTFFHHAKTKPVNQRNRLIREADDKLRTDPAFRRAVAEYIGEQMAEEGYVFTRDESARAKKGGAQ